MEDKAKLAIQSLAITNQRLSALQSNELNPRLHTKAQIRSTASIETFGFNVPILVDSTLKIIAGHGRVLAAKHLGLREVPTRMVKKLKRPQELRRLPKRLNLDGG